MNELTIELIEKAKQKGIISQIVPPMPIAYISSAELYLTFKCNDRCAHCITESGANRNETITPEDAEVIVDNITEYSVLNSIHKLLGQGKYSYTTPGLCKKLDEMKSPPNKLIFSLIEDYNACALGRGGLSEWTTEKETFPLNFRRPCIRLSGGEFYMWPASLNGKELSEDERLDYQQKLIAKIRSALPEYDLWILTNGRFATDKEKTDKIIGNWSRYADTTSEKGKVRICVSVDIFHRPPKQSTVKEMLDRIWSSSWEHGFMAPHLYGIPNHMIGLVGRALGKFSPGRLLINSIKNSSKSSFNPFTSLLVDPYDLVEKGGCNETKGFIVQIKKDYMLVHNVYIAPSGHLVYCCACVGDYGDFLNSPDECMKDIVSDPLASALRKRETVGPLLNLAAELDHTIKIYGEGEYPAATGSTCYQVLSGKRIHFS